jgi:hypothetical protein
LQLAPLCTTKKHLITQNSRNNYAGDLRTAQANLCFMTAEVSSQAKLVKLADKICNVRDMSPSPPVDWSLERRAEYFTWAKQVVDLMRGVSPELENLFDAALPGHST